jgi:hypothetical protein
MSLTITHFNLQSNRWAIRFAGEREEFEVMRTWLQSMPGFYARWTMAVVWPDGKQGAWLIHGAALRLAIDHFRNLRGTCEESHKGSAHIYNCRFWLEVDRSPATVCEYNLPQPVILSSPRRAMATH